MVVLHSNPSLRAADACISHLRARMLAAILRVLHTHPGFFPSVKIEERVPLPKVCHALRIKPVNGSVHAGYHGKAHITLDKCAVGPGRAMLAVDALCGVRGGDGRDLGFAVGGRARAQSVSAVVQSGRTAEHRHSLPETQSHPYRCQWEATVRCRSGCGKH